MSPAQMTVELAKPFSDNEVKWKPQVVKGNRCLAMPYIDARLIMDRLDDVLGVENWRDDYSIIADGSVVCALSLRLGGEWISKADVGSPSDQPDAGDRLKAAFSDALKRAAVKFGIGRHLYRMGAEWAEYDPVKKQIISPPPPVKIIPPRGGSGTAPPRSNRTLPANGGELVQRIEEHDAKLSAEGRCKPGELKAFVLAAGRENGHPEDLSKWSGRAILFAVDAVRRFEVAYPAPVAK